MPIHETYCKCDQDDLLAIHFVLVRDKLHILSIPVLWILYIVVSESDYVVLMPQCSLEFPQCCY